MSRQNLEVDVRQLHHNLVGTITRMRIKNKYFKRHLDVEIKDLASKLVAKIRGGQPENSRFIHIAKVEKLPETFKCLGKKLHSNTRFYINGHPIPAYFEKRRCKPFLLKVDLKTSTCNLTAKVLYTPTITVDSLESFDSKSYFKGKKAKKLEKFELMGKEIENSFTTGTSYNEVEKEAGASCDTECENPLKFSAESTHKRRENEIASCGFFIDGNSEAFKEYLDEITFNVLEDHRQVAIQNFEKIRQLTEVLGQVSSTILERIGKGLPLKYDPKEDKLRFDCHCCPLHCPQFFKTKSVKFRGRPTKTNENGKNQPASRENSLL